MKPIITVTLKTRTAAAAECKTSMLAVGLFSDAKTLDAENKKLDLKLGGAIEQLIKLGDFKGKAGTSILLYTSGQIGAKRVLLVGLGKRKEAGVDTIRKAAALAANKAASIKAGTVALAIHKSFGAGFDTSLLAQAMAEGVYFGSYRYDEYITSNEDNGKDTLAVDVIDESAAKIRRLQKGLETGAIIGRAQSYARTIASRPANVINPPSLAQEAKKLARATPGLSCSVLDEKQMAKMGMGGILAVGSGSKSPPRFIAIKYSPKTPRAMKLPKVGLVGKAITFDSGGISIKPAQNMDRMKLDKTGGIAVLATARAVAELKLSVNLLAIIPSAENMPGGASYRPGDIVKTYSGKTVEIQNTDAEGRMVLCDGIHYAVQQKCDTIIDIATLTGSCMVALGTHKAGLMSSDEKLTKQLQQAAENSGEMVWPLPCGDEYAQEMKSKIADYKNTGSKWGGACTAAAFLRQFAGQTKWAHLDIAGMDYIEKPTEWSVAGASAFGVRLLTAYLINLTKSKGKQ